MVQIGGQKLCDVARKGKELERQPRTVTGGSVGVSLGGWVLCGDAFWGD